MSFSLVPGFNQRYPLDRDNDSLILPDPNEPCHARSDRTSHSSVKPGPDEPRHARLDRASLLIESCCTTLDEALSAQSRGASRIELCTDLSVGGLTPPRDLIRTVISSLTIPVNVLIRHCVTGALPQTPSLRPAIAQASPTRSPLASDAASTLAGSTPSVMPGFDRASIKIIGFSAADFIYDEVDLQQMTEDIAYCKSVGAAGIVIGALTPEGTIDLQAMRRLIAAARPLTVTFHRAFDVCTEDPFTALDKIIALGCTRLLSSGQAPTAWDGRNLLTLLVRRAGPRLIIMPGCGITPDNLPSLAAATRAFEFHGTRIP
ncbi:MAG: hypothetical protein IKX53_05925 [Bacteroidales bacterium]|nr:hypothetical protein [Bacteroidales bacterium]